LQKITIMVWSDEKLISLALPLLGILDVLITTVAFLLHGEIPTERNPIVRDIAGSHNIILYYFWSVLYILFLTYLSKWLISESYKSKRGEETAFGKLLRRTVHDPKSIGRYDPNHFYVVLYSCLVGLYVMIVVTNLFVLREVTPTFMENLLTYIISLFSTASVAYFLTKSKIIS